MWFVDSFNFLIVFATGSPLRVASSTNCSISFHEIWLAKAERTTWIAWSINGWFISINRAFCSSISWTWWRFANRFSWSFFMFASFFIASRSCSHYGEKLLYAEILLLYFAQQFFFTCCTAFKSSFWLSIFEKNSSTAWLKVGNSRNGFDSCCLYKIGWNSWLV